jgi:hypothetical protein
MRRNRRRSHRGGIRSKKSTGSVNHSEGLRPSDSRTRSLAGAPKPHSARVGSLARSFARCPVLGFEPVLLLFAAGADGSSRQLLEEGLRLGRSLDASTKDDGLGVAVRAVYIGVRIFVRSEHAT